MSTGTWTESATRNTANSKSSVASRNITCFEVLDYDSLTHVLVDGNYVSVICLIYKKITISHTQNRRYTLNYSHPEANIKDTGMITMPSWYLDSVPATDNFDYSGTRTVEYKLCLIVGDQQYVTELGTVGIEVSGYHNLSGTDKELKEEAAEESSGGPFFTVIGNRLYGVNVNCGKEAITYTYDIESLDPSKSFSNNALFQFDSPVNLEDYNDNWIKQERVVGAMNYYGIADDKHFSYTEPDPSDAELPDTVLAVGYGIF